MATTRDAQRKRKAPTGKKGTPRAGGASQKPSLASRLRAAVQKHPVRAAGAVVATGAAIAAAVVLGTNPKARARAGKALASGAARAARVGAKGAEQASRATSQALAAVTPAAKQAKNQAQKTSKAAFAAVRRLLK